jgi:hypothetical protein
LIDYRHSQVSASLAALALLAGSPANADELCAELVLFEKADLPSTGEQARWIELHWQGRWMDLKSGWGLACISSDEVAARLCSFVVKNTSYEFASNFPERILACHGYVIPNGIANWRGEVDVEMASDRWHKLVIDLGERSEDSGAVRYVSVSDETAGGNDIEYLPIAPLPSDEDE